MKLDDSELPSEDNPVATSNTMTCMDVKMDIAEEENNKSLFCFTIILATCISTLNAAKFVFNNQD